MRYAGLVRTLSGRGPTGAPRFRTFMPSNVVVYTAPLCFFCVRVKQLLAKKGVAFSEVDVRSLADGRRWLRARTGRTSVPQIFINDVFVGGYAELASLERDGALDELLQEPTH